LQEPQINPCKQNSSCQIKFVQHLASSKLIFKKNFLPKKWILEPQKKIKIICESLSPSHYTLIATHLGATYTMNQIEASTCGSST
jgi:hypothetical protein